MKTATKKATRKSKKTVAEATAETTAEAAAKKSAKTTEDRIREIAAEIASITEFAEGSIASSRKRYRVKGGAERRASPQYRFKSKGARGKQVSKYVPAELAPRVKKLVEDGRRYRRLEAEYSRLVTEASLESLKKKGAAEG